MVFFEKLYKREKEENEELKAENEKLTAENEKLTDDIDDAVENHFADLKLRETTHKEWDTLEEENEKLKEFRKNQGIDQELLGSLEAENYKLLQTTALLLAENKDITEQLEEMYSKHPSGTEEEFLERHGITAEEKKMLLAQCS